MGRLIFPPLAAVYLDTAPIIYSVEKHADYWHLLTPLWQALRERQIEVFTSELTLLETLVHPLKHDNQMLVEAYETLLTKTDIRLLPIKADILRDAANLRAVQNFKTPDAIHAATAEASGCTYFITNDNGFKRLVHLNVIVLSELF